MREIVFDTETTGLDPRNGDRVVEIGCVELVNHFPTGRKFHRYVNPERPMSIDAARVHGLDDAFLRDKPLFAAIAGELIEFVGDARLIAHNAQFDLDFLNVELTRAGHPALHRRPHRRFADAGPAPAPGRPELARRALRPLQIDRSRRTLHGALLDAELLAEVYIELIGGRQASLVLGDAMAGASLVVATRSEIQIARRGPRTATVPCHGRRDGGASAAPREARAERDLARISRQGGSRPRVPLSPAAHHCPSPPPPPGNSRESSRAPAPLGAWQRSWNPSQLISCLPATPERASGSSISARD